jgi:hypothetical protein
MRWLASFGGRAQTRKKRISNGVAFHIAYVYVPVERVK